jgi:uncharacterized membrane protein YphA (DoxX/SURF4 family)
MNTKKVWYWTTTGFVAFALLSGGVADMMHLRPVVEGMSRIGYPMYFLTMVGLWKALGGLALVWSGLPRLKEWAYAGVFFVLTGAAVSHAVCGEMGHVIAPTVLAVMSIVSWALWPKSRMLGVPVPERLNGHMAPAEAFSQREDMA